MIAKGIPNNKTTKGMERKSNKIDIFSLYNTGDIKSSEYNKKS